MKFMGYFNLPYIKINSAIISDVSSRPTVAGDGLKVGLRRARHFSRSSRLLFGGAGEFLVIAAYQP